MSTGSAPPGPWSPLQFQQRWLFDNAGLTAAPYTAWLAASPRPAHLDSRVIARGGIEDGAAPTGYHPVLARQIGRQTLCSTYELVASCCDLIAEDLLDHHTADPDGPVRALAWVDAVAHQISTVNWNG